MGFIFTRGFLEVLIASAQYLRANPSPSVSIFGIPLVTNSFRAELKLCGWNGVDESKQPLWVELWDGQLPKGLFAQ